MKILGYVYRLTNDGVADTMGAFGRYHVKNQTIQIASDLCNEQLISSVLHEVLEALNYHLELKLDHSAIMSLEAGLFQTFKDNGIDLSPLAKELKDKKDEEADPFRLLGMKR